MRSGRNFGKERSGANQLLQKAAPTEINGFAQLYAYDLKHTSHKTSDEHMYLNMDMKCQWEKNWLPFFSRAHDYS